MSTPKRKNKDRDAEVTKRRLLEAVGFILRTKGHHALRTNNIAREVGRNKNVIRHHFLGLANLKRAYIFDRDYWLPFFERFDLPKLATMPEIRDMFIQLMQENLKFFYEDDEIQKIILWQISEENSLMKTISDKREAEGEKLLAMTDRHFADTGISFRSIIGLLLGGSYYMVLHAHTNGSKVCGADLNSDRGRAEVHRTIEQIISWAWQHAQENLKRKIKTTKIMNNELEHLERLAMEFLAKDKTSEPPKVEELIKEIKRVEIVVKSQLIDQTNETQIRTSLQVNMHGLVRICDLFYSADVDSNPEAKLILNLMEDIRTPVAEYIPDSILLPKLFRAMESQRFDGKWQIIAFEMIRLGIDESIIAIAEIPIIRFINSEKKMFWSDFKYLKKFLDILEQVIGEPMVSETGLLNTMIGLGFNHSRLTAYFALKVKNDIANASVRETKFKLRTYRARIRQLTIYTNMKFDKEKISPVDELTKWIEAELSVLDEDAEDLENPLRINTKLDEIQIAWWQKLQQKHGIYDEGHQGMLAKKTAFNFNGKGQKGFAELKFRFDPAEVKALVPLKKKIEGMLEEVTELLK